MGDFTTLDVVLSAILLLFVSVTFVWLVRSWIFSTMVLPITNVVAFFAFVIVGAGADIAWHLWWKRKVEGNT